MLSIDIPYAKCREIITVIIIIAKVQLFSSIIHCFADPPLAPGPPTLHEYHYMSHEYVMIFKYITLEN